MPENENALAVRVQQEVSTLEVQAAHIKVTDKHSYIDACQFVLDGRARIKAVGRELDPGIAKAKDAVDMAKASLDHLKNQKQKWVDLYAVPLELVEGKCAAFDAEEKRQARLEQDRINEKARLDAAAKAAEERRIADAKAETDRKARQKEIDAMRAAGELKARDTARLKKEADERAAVERKLNEEQAAKTAADVQTVTVQRATPVVSGIRRTENFYAEMEDPGALIAAFISGPAAQRIFLHQFVIVNDKAVGKFARDTKDSQKVESLIPGVRAWSENSI
jgi:hypothetical protein